MRLLTWERYVPDVEDNRARQTDGRPALVVELRPPTARVWMAFQRAVLEDPGHRARFLELAAAYGEGAGLQLIAKIGTFHDDLAALLWAGCVGRVECPPDLIAGLTEPVPDGAALWALRDRLDAAELYTEILDALLKRATLEAGLAVPLASGSGPSTVPSPVLAPAGAAAPTPAASSPS